MFKVGGKAMCIASGGGWTDIDTYEVTHGPKRREIVTIDGLVIYYDELYLILSGYNMVDESGERESFCAESFIPLSDISTELSTTTINEFLSETVEA